MNVTTILIVNREAPPFDNPDLRRAIALALDRKAFIDILSQGNADVGGTMQPPEAGFWGMPAEMLAAVPGYGPDVQKNREEARALMKKLGYGPDKRLPLKVSTRGISIYKDAAVIFASQLKEIWIDAEVDIIETSQWFAKIGRKAYSVGLNTTGNGVDDPDQNYFENFSCKSERNYTGYCNPEIEKLFEVQSAETDFDKRRKIVWEIDRKLLEDGARPVVMWNRSGTCMQPYVKGYVAHVNSVYNGFRFAFGYDLWFRDFYGDTYDPAPGYEAMPANARIEVLLPDTAAQVWLRIGGRDLLLTATPDALGLGPELDVGYVAFAEPDCAGSAWFVPAFGVPLVFTPVALGPGNTLFAPDGPLDFVGTNSAWHPSAPTPCQPEPGGFVQLQRALGILDLGTFSPPFTVR
jgi:hypothetical protein